MLAIRPQQMFVFEEAASAAFEARLARHMLSHFPARCASLGAGGLEELCRHGVAAARGYGIITERDICKYVSLAVVLGRDFDVDPALPWARALLTAEHTGATLRINRLYLEAIERLDAGADR